MSYHFSLLLLYCSLTRLKKGILNEKTRCLALWLNTMITKEKQTEASTWEMSAVLILHQDNLSQIAYRWGERIQPHYRIHELSRKKHSCILNRLLWVKVLTTNCMKRVFRVGLSAYICTCQQFRDETHMHTHSPRGTIH